MKKVLATILIFSITFVLFIPNNIVSAAKPHTVNTKIHTYKGQKYVQITGGNQQVKDKINKVLKTYAVKASQENVELKKQQNYFYRQTTSETKFNNNQRLSVVFKDYYYKGGVHGYEEATTYNFDLKTGSQLFLNNVTKTNQQSVNLFDGIESGLRVKKEVFDDKIRNFPLSKKSSFYYYNDGIVIIFDPYQVGPYVAGFIEVKVPYTRIQSNNTLPFLDLTKDSVKYLKQGKLPGFKEISFGKTIKQVSDALNSKVRESYYESGGLFWIFERWNYASFNFSEESGRLAYVYLSARAFPMKGFDDIEKILGKGTRFESTEYEGEFVLTYQFDNVYLEFTSESPKESVNAIKISKR